MKFKLLVIFLPYLVLKTSVIGIEVFTSVYHMDNFYNHEANLLYNLHDFITTLQSKILVLQERYTQLLAARGSNHDDPLRAFSLIRRLAREWPLVLSIMAENTGIPEGIPSFPAEKETHSALSGLLRLQEMYGLDTIDLARRGLSGQDMLELGKQSYRQGSYTQAQSWLQGALDVFAAEERSMRAETAAYLYLAKLRHGCQENGKSPGQSTLLYRILKEKLALTLDSILAEELKVAMSNCTALNINEINRVQLPKRETLYKKICRDGGAEIKGLNCYYVTYRHPGLLLRPVKLEELHIDPPIVMLHDVISDHEIQELTDVFYTVIEDCQIIDNYTATVNRYRTCNVGWLQDNSTAASQRLTTRLGHVTNLSTTVAEYNQVASYGVGGEFQMHLDAFQEGQGHLSEDNAEGNRIATVLIYMSDVASGGHTVFPYLNVSIAPQKGNAVVWYNLMTDGQPDRSLEHASCPVLRGTKWILNKWIREGGQEFQYSSPIDRHASRKYYYL